MKTYEITITRTYTVEADSKQGAWENVDESEYVDSELQEYEVEEV